MAYIIYLAVSRAFRVNSCFDFPKPHYSTSASRTSHHCKRPKAKPTYAQPNGRGKANEQRARTKRLCWAACPCPQRLTRRELAVHHCTSCLMLCFFSSSARAVQPEPDQPALNPYGRWRSRIAWAPWRESDHLAKHCHSLSLKL